MKTDPRVDAYIAQAPEFAQPILREARSRVAKACPSAEETIKWNVPFFLLDDKILASMAAFKKHVKVGVWTGMMPKFADVSDVEELPPSKDFAQQLLTAAKAIDGAMTSKPAKASAPKLAKEPSAKTTSAKTTSAKTTSAKTTSAKTTSAKTTSAKTTSAKAVAKKTPLKAVAKKLPAQAVAKQAPAKAATKKAPAKKAPSSKK